ncbi:MULTISPECIES: NAD/NADP octopine/nopaline dehydrogenase family protein [unclassified Pseudomonas]|uniref:NAD/NADP octopine/nopaline dehydrogenase family protein n=1 Tax=unclassified Pseudomonas TaxID=196821 RepID=UPI002A3722EC|nr:MULTISPECIES: NAD/NADP octopine/nopaline dehydrogenase family protein [unclassified Pseudomonas]MDX9669131.1 NAD/NADP octopine/nopaline dehydrogenase family protein [Pseudomonas sp. P8_250]WPN36825.1 NAD/NADP octopine/nopaline dehydrogenase family protein [Pseudomonas sp. P8_139]WPN41374.1 NAD/NADP octopine/nopaline dehydrogenase family protein [Pseudomonas sp. P8_229]
MNLLKVAICGGGRTGHLNAILFKQLPDVQVSMLTSNLEIIEQHARQTPMQALLPDGSTLSARLDRVTTDARAAVEDADIVIITVPAHARAQILKDIAPHLNASKPVYIGAIPGFCGFDWLAEATLPDRPNLVIWGMKDVPHTAFELTPGRSIKMGGGKSQLYVATHAREPQTARRQLEKILTRLYGPCVTMLENYLEITLTPGNPIMHSSVIYGLIGPYGQWHRKIFPQRMCWWTECPELGAYFLERMDQESQDLCAVISQRMGVDLSSVKSLKQEIVEAYGEQIRDQSSMLSILRTNQAYNDILAPMVPAADNRAGYVIERESRAFNEDVAYGLVLLVEMAKRFDLKVPYIEEVLHWSVDYMQGLRDSALDYFPSHWPRTTSAAA